MHLWCQLIPQACLVLNLLWQLRINPTLSAYTQLNGSYESNATPVSPPGTCVVVHEKPEVRGRWEIWRIDGWYLGHAINHYRYFEVFKNNTYHIRIEGTVEFSPHKFTMPLPSSVDNTIEAAKKLAHALQNPAPSTLLSQLGDSTMADIKQLSVVLRR